MIGRQSLKLWVIFLALIFMLNAHALAKEATGRVTLVIGKAYLYNGSNKSPDYLKGSLRKYKLWKKLRVRSILKTGDVIHVPKKSRMDIVFHNERLRLDGPTLFQIKDLSEIRESKRFLFLFKRKRTKKVSKFKLFFGRVMAKVNKLRRQDIHDLETPTAVMGVYGTSYLASSTPKGKGDLSVVSGEVRVTFKDTPDKSHSIFAGNQLGLLVKRGEQVEIKTIPEKVRKKLLSAMENIKEKPDAPLPGEDNKVDETDEIKEEVDEEVKEDETPEDEQKKTEEEEKGTLEDLMQEELPPLDLEILEDELFPEGDSGEGFEGEVKPPLDEEGEPPEIKESFFQENPFDPFNAETVIRPGLNDIIKPPSSTEREKMRVKIRLNWTDLN